LKSDAHPVSARISKGSNMKARFSFQRLFAALVVVFLYSGCMIADNLSGTTQARELQKTGLPAKATILKISDSGITINDDPVAWLDLEVHPAKGAAFRARTKCLISRLEVPQFQPGCSIPVRYDPGDHTRVGVEVDR
jgi:hypothetical protein